MLSSLFLPENDALLIECLMLVFSAMNYFHYLSATKADMLFPQIPPEFLDGIKVELGFNFGVLQGKLSGEQKNNDAAVARVIAIEKYFETKNLIRSEIAEGTWFRAELEAKMGFLPQCPGLVLFGGHVDDTVLLLAGSESNLTSGSKNTGLDKGWSFLPRLLDNLKFLINLNLDVNADSKAAEDLVFGNLGRDIRTNEFSAFYEIPDEALPGPAIKLSVFARIFLVRTNSWGQRLAIGSPLYVSEPT